MNKFKETLNINNITIHYILLIVITFIIAFFLSSFLRKIIGLFITKYAKRLKTDPTNFAFIKNSVRFLVYSSAITFIFYKIPYLKSLSAALFAGAGVLAIVVGFASQKAFSNIISGIFILFSKPFKMADVIEFKDGRKGVVEEITLRHTIINDYENRRIIIPNSVINEETIINSNINDEKIRQHIKFSIAYDADINKAIKIIREESQKHPSFIDNRTKQEKDKHEPAVIVRVVELNDFAVDLKAYVWSSGNDIAFALKCDLLKSVKERFDKEGIEIPFPYRTIVYKKDLKK